MLSIRFEQVAVQSPTFPQLISRQQEVEPQHQREQHQLLAGHPDRWQALEQPFPRTQQDLKGCEQDETSDAQGSHRLVFAVAVGVIPVGARIGQFVGDQSREAGQRIGGAVHAIGDHRQGTTHGPHQKLQQRHADVQAQGHHEDSAHPLAVVDHRDGMTVRHG